MQQGSRPARHDKRRGADVLRSLLKRTISRAAGWYPNTFFYGAEMQTKFNGMLRKERSTRDGQKMTPLAQAALMMSIAVSEGMSEGDTLSATFHGATYRSEDRGTFKVTVERLA